MIEEVDEEDDERDIDLGKLLLTTSQQDFFFLKLQVI